VTPDKRLVQGDHDSSISGFQGFKELKYKLDQHFDNESNGDQVTVQKPKCNLDSTSSPY
jgi:hypothetical protein